MRLPQYEYTQNGAYFVTVCTKERRKVLCDIVGDKVGFGHNTILKNFDQ